MASSEHYVVVFPFMAQGHTLPLLDLSMAISGFGVKVTIITTPSNAPKILSEVSMNPNIALSILPFPRVEGIPEGCENTADLPSGDLFLPFVAATKSLKQPFEDFLRNACETGRAPLCVISDFFLEWTLDVCNLFGIPRIVFHGLGVLTMSISKAAFRNALGLDGIRGEHDPEDSRPLDLKPLGISLAFTVYKTDIPALNRLKDLNNPWRKALAETEKSDENSWGVLVNSFEGLEGDYVASLESVFNHGARAWCVGPGLLWKLPCQADILPQNHKSNPYMEWLNVKLVEMDGVIYVSFGTQSHLSDKQMDEIARGLEMSGKAFVWVVRSTSWACSDIGWEARVKDKGLVVRDWVHQRAILTHPLVRGFISHCGWNSVLESLCSGVPILAWPVDHDQPLNARIVAKRFGAGIMLKEEGAVGGIIGADLISKGVKELMGGERGRQARERAGEIARKAREAVEIGGSSYKKLDELIQCLKREKKAGDMGLDC
ncbi:UDP-glycosyltransferase 90A1-like [Punica granatum]|uniref:Glycosyltransferase n=2 Tax=Punica granatum TaxID=22663 RepID=A0A218VXA4_PUNGR|nr:UDP-glycosyltransferase 90A1-like [Punica granatum]OWM65046.1 hypothetical protein CDL15_Pgr028764 [Punica granatum]PKI76512.1 hypothetical protein CRG98_003063 [Punica granatum]